MSLTIEKREAIIVINPTSKLDLLLFLLLNEIIVSVLFSAIEMFPFRNKYLYCIAVLGLR